MEETVLNGIFSEENLKQYRAMSPKGVKKIDITAIDSKCCDYIMENWSDAEALCVELAKQYPQFIFVLYFEQTDGEVFHIFHAIAMKHTRIKRRRKLQEMALTYDPQYCPNFEIDFEAQTVSEL